MAQFYPKPIADLIESFEHFPGVGRKMAQRLAFHVLKMDDETIDFISKSIINAKKDITICSVCCNIAGNDPCNICKSQRDKSIICVVEHPKDVLAMERTNAFNGKYHVLHGIISPMEGIGPENIRLKELLRRLDEKVKEIVIALNPTVEGEATAIYISRLITPMNIKVTRIAHGVSVGTNIEYADEMTLTKALQGRTSI